MEPNETSATRRWAARTILARVARRLRRPAKHPAYDPGSRRWAARTIMLLVVALVLSVIAATAAGFWLSYAGLHAFAFRGGLRGFEAWAWPASVDLFILAGELGVTISAVRGKADGIAWAYLIGGAALSVLFNIVHVWPGPVWWGRYAVAAVPPVAAILALAALLRQVVKVVSTSGGTVPSPATDGAESLAEKVLRATWLAGNPLNLHQLETRFDLKRAEAKKLRERVIPQTPAAADPAPLHPPGDGQPPRPVRPPAGTAVPPPADTVPAGPSLAAATKNGGRRG